MESLEDQETFEFGDVVLDRRSRAVTVDGERVHLTGSEYALLDVLSQHPGKAFSSRELLSAMWGSDWLADTTALQVHASRLRHKLGESGSAPRYIQTVHGFGYRLDARARAAQHPVSQIEERDSECAAVDSVEVPTRPDVLADLDRIVQWVSPRFTGLLGWAPESLVGKSIYDLFHPEDKPQGLAARADLDLGHASSVVFRARTADSGFRWVEAEIWPVNGRNAETVAFFAQILAIDGQPDIETLDPVSSGSAADEDRTVELSYDADFIVRAILPHRPFLSWDPDDIVGSFFSPHGFDAQTLRGMAQALVAQGRLEVEASLPATDAEGVTRNIPIVSRLQTDDEGHLLGLKSTFYLQ